jgi:putative ABC transport system permease protein
MMILARILRRAAFWLHAGRHAADLSAEIEHHRARTQAALEAGGVPAADAAARSRRAMGNIVLAREDARAVWMWPALERTWRDARYGARALRREPTFAVTAILTLALGVGSTTAVFSVVDAELWKPLPFPEANQLVALYTTGPGATTSYERVSGPDLLDWRRQSQSFTELAGYVWSSRHVLRRRGITESVTGTAVTSSFFATLRYPVRLGRPLGAVDERSARSVVLSDACWRRSFASDPAVVGQTMVLDDRDYVIVGVTGADAHLDFMTDPDLFTVVDESSSDLRDRSARTLSAIGRMKPGVDITRAQAEMQTIANRIARDYPADHAGRGVRVEGLESDTGHNWRPLYFFLGAALFVLLLSCTNVANLLLGRALRRQREFAIRGALGGGRGALVRQLLVEGLLVAVPGTGTGILLATWTLGVISIRLPEGYLERGGHFALDWRVGMFALLICGLTAVIFGLAPVLFARRLDLNVILGQGGRSLGGSHLQRRLRHALVIAEVMMTLVLLVGAGLFLRSFMGVTRMPLGFEPGDRITMRLPLAGPRYADRRRTVGFLNDLLDEVRAIPGVRDAAAGNSLPLGSGPTTRFVVGDRPLPPPGDEATAIVRVVTPAYFRTLAIPTVAGREFNDRDVDGGPRVAIINAHLAQRMFPGDDPIGRELTIPPGGRTAWVKSGAIQIVGVVSNVKDVGMNEVEFDDIYMPLAQTPPPSVQLVLNAAVAAPRVVDAVRGAVARLDPGLPVIGVSTLTQTVDNAMRVDRFNLLLISSFAAIALALAAVGVYGATAYAIEQRTQEFGVRLALGATRRTILLAALGQSARFGVAGAVLGLGVSLALARVLGNALYLVPKQHGGLLYGVSTTDPVTLVSACAVLITIAAGSGLVPARRATRIDPLVALRAE